MDNNTYFKDSIRKDNENISFPNGFPELKVNGDYHIIHKYDTNLNNSRVMKEKLEQLNTWMKFTFPSQLPPETLENENCLNASKIYSSDFKDEFNKIIDWLLDPKDN